MIPVHSGPFEDYIDDHRRSESVSVGYDPERKARFVSNLARTTSAETNVWVSDRPHQQQMVSTLPPAGQFPIGRLVTNENVYVAQGGSEAVSVIDYTNGQASA
jgi:DNA-binding beta-propeller fold protein YncE